MKNITLGFLLAIVLIIGTATTTVSVMTIKPSIPKSTIVFVGRGYDIANFIKSNSSKGYIVKHFSNLTGLAGKPGDIVVMEKY